MPLSVTDNFWFTMNNAWACGMSVRHRYPRFAGSDGVGGSKGVGGAGSAPSGAPTQTLNWRSAGIDVFIAEAMAEVPDESMVIGAVLPPSHDCCQPDESTTTRCFRTKSLDNARLVVVISDPLLQKLNARYCCSQRS